MKVTEYGKLLDLLDNSGMKSIFVLDNDGNEGVVVSVNRGNKTIDISFNEGEREKATVSMEDFNANYSVVYAENEYTELGYIDINELYREE